MKSRLLAPLEDLKKPVRRGLPNGQFHSVSSCVSWCSFTMRYYSLLFLAVFSGVVAGDDLFGMRLTTETSLKKESTQYRFHYFVKDDTTGDYKVQEETKQGNLVQGSYTLAEPNGDLRTVTYKAGPGKGFEAKVDVHPSGSPMKQTTKEIPVSEVTTTPENVGRTGRPTTIESTVKHYPGGFKMDVLSKPSDVKTEMGMEFSLKADAHTPPVTLSTDAVFESNKTEKLETTEPTKTTYSVDTPSDSTVSSPVENSTFPTEGREISEDQIEKEIDEVINSMPKMPELVLSDNKTRFKFHKDPEEALLDERITQIARQLAETSLRREYEERKLGHFIPISVSSVEPSTSRYLSKSFKYTKNDFKHVEPSTLHVLTQLKIVPQYIYKQTLIPRLFPINNRLLVASRPAQVTQPWLMQTQETITNPPELLKINKSENKLHEIFRNSHQNQERTTVGAQPASVMPVHVPTLMQFFSPYVMHNPESYITPSRPEPPLYTSTVNKDFTMGEVPVSDSSLYTHVTIVNDHNTEKP